MSTLEFREAVEHALATNPFLEEPENEPASSPASTSFSVAAITEEERERVPAKTTDDTFVSATISDAHAPDKPFPGDYPLPHNSSSTDTLSLNPMRVSLQDRLFQALSTLHLSKRDRQLASYIINALDMDGYLRKPLSSLPEKNAFNPPASDTEWRAALHRIQQLHAPGIGARTLRECLLIQLQSKAQENADNPVHALAMAIVDQHLSQLARNDWTRLLRIHGANPDTLRQACDMIRCLDPRPGLRYDHSPVHYAIPDVMIDKVGAQWRIRLNESTVPRARLNRQYAEWLQRAEGDQRTPLQRELQEARWLIRNVEHRYATILRVAEAIVLRQRRFLDYGDVALRPLMLREIADDLDIHESTVSRATAGKYMATPRGIFEFRHFFSRELTTEADGSCSASAVRALLREMIKDEDPADPLSDVALARDLARHGIIVARRTVTKYRGQLKIPAVDRRKSH